MTTTVVNPYWNIFEPAVADRSTKSYEFKEYKEVNVNVRELEQFEFEIKESENWKLLSNAYLYVKSQVTDNSVGGDKLVTVCNNGLNDFKKAQLFYEDKELETVDYIGIASTIANLVDFSGDVSETVASQLGWYKDTSDSADWDL
jgi:transcription elongation GreA/GreB family factor